MMLPLQWLMYVPLSVASVQETARYIASVSAECKMEVDPEEFVQSFRPNLMDVTYAWSKGETFGEVGGRMVCMLRITKYPCMGIGMYMLRATAVLCRAVSWRHAAEQPSLFLVSGTT